MSAAEHDAEGVRTPPGMGTSPQTQYDPTDPFTLLCEKCGYVVEGLDQDSVCPECGKPIAESLPGHRVGTPWQQKPGLKSLVQTWGGLILHPIRTCSRLTPRTSKRELGLLLITLIFASTLIGIGFTYPAYISDDTFDPPYQPDLRMNILTTGTFAAVAMVFLGILTSIEYMAILILGSLRGKNPRKAYRKSILAHATATWILSSFIYLATAIIGWTLRDHFMPEPPTDDSPLSQYVHIFNTPPQWVAILRSFMKYGAILFGISYFAIVLTIGCRRCRYANRVRPQDSLPNEPRPSGSGL